MFGPTWYPRLDLSQVCDRFILWLSLHMAAAALIDYGIHANLTRGQLLSVGWQVFVYFPMGAGEIFIYAMAYEAAFEVAPKEQKGDGIGL